MLAISDVTVAEGSPAVFPVTLSAPAQITFTVQFSTTAITAVSPQDYNHTVGTLTFTPGQTAKTISVPTLSDTRNEDTETFRVRLYGQTYVLIADGDGVVFLSGNRDWLYRPLTELSAETLSRIQQTRTYDGVDLAAARALLENPDRLVLQGPGAELLRNPQVQQAYMGM